MASLVSFRKDWKKTEQLYESSERRSFRYLCALERRSFDTHISHETGPYIKPKKYITLKENEYKCHITSSNVRIYIINTLKLV